MIIITCQYRQFIIIIICTELENVRRIEWTERIVNEKRNELTKYYRSNIFPLQLITKTKNSDSGVNLSKYFTFQTRDSIDTSGGPVNFKFPRIMTACV